MSKKLEEILADLHLATTKELLVRIQNGEATASELNVARQMLKDNDITLGMLDQDSPLENLAQEVSKQDVWSEQDEEYFTH